MCSRGPLQCFPLNSMDGRLRASLDWEGAVCVDGVGCRTWQDSALPLYPPWLWGASMFQGHQTLSLCAWLLLRPTLPFPDGRADSKRARLIPVSTEQPPRSGDAAVMEVGHSDVCLSLKA